MTTKKPIQAELIEYRCTKCDKGVYRQTGVVAKNTNPVNFEHACSSCGHTVMFTIGYPVIEYKGKKFMLADAMRLLGEMPVPAI